MHPARRPDAGIERPRLQNRLIERGSILPIVFVTGYADTPTTVRAIKAGAEDFLTKPASPEQLIDAIERAMARPGRTPSTERVKFPSRARSDPDAARATRFSNLIVRGKTNKQIAHELDTTERTVKAHRHQVMEKMQVDSFAELVFERGTAWRAGSEPRFKQMIDAPQLRSVPERPCHVRTYEDLVTMCQNGWAMKRIAEPLVEHIVPTRRSVLSWTMTRQCHGHRAVAESSRFHSTLFESASALLAYGDFDKAFCFIVDINLNGESGIELCGRLADSGVSLPSSISPATTAKRTARAQSRRVASPT